MKDKKTYEPLMYGNSIYLVLYMCIWDMITNIFDSEVLSGILHIS